MDAAWPFPVSLIITKSGWCCWLLYVARSVIHLRVITHPVIGRAHCSTTSSEQRV